MMVTSDTGTLLQSWIRLKFEDPYVYFDGF